MVRGQWREFGQDTGVCSCVSIHVFVCVYVCVCACVYMCLCVWGGGTNHSSVICFPFS